LDCWSKGYATSDHKFEPNRADISLTFDDDMIRFLVAIVQSGSFFNQNSDAGLEDIRRRLYIPETESGTPTLKFRADLHSSRPLPIPIQNGSMPVTP